MFIRNSLGIRSLWRARRNRLRIFLVIVGDLCHLAGVKQSRLLDQLVKEALLLDQVAWRIKFGNLAGLEYHNPVTVEHSVDSVRDRDDCTMLECLASQRLLNEIVRLDVDRGLGHGQCVLI